MHVEIKRAMFGSDSCEDALVDYVYAYVTQNSYPIGCSATRKRQIRKRAERFSVKEGHLYYTLKKGGKQVETRVLSAKHCLIVLFCVGNYCEVCTEPKRTDAGRSGLSRGRNVRSFWGR